MKDLIGIERLLNKLKLKDSLTLEIQIDRVVFMEKLSSITTEEKIFPDVLYIFSSKKYEFYGVINYDDFRLKSRRRIFDVNLNWAIAKLKVHESKGGLKIETEINAIPNLLVSMLLLILIVFSVVYRVIQSDSNLSIATRLFLLIFCSLTMCITYFMMKQSVKKLKNELERIFMKISNS